MGDFGNLGETQPDHPDEDEVTRPHAGPLVAGDAHHAVCRDGSDPSLVGDTPGRPEAPVDPDAAIPAVGDVAAPVPAVWGLLDVQEEAGGVHSQRAFRSAVTVHETHISPGRAASSRSQIGHS